MGPGVNPGPLCLFVDAVDASDDRLLAYVVDFVADDYVAASVYVA